MKAPLQRLCMETLYLQRSHDAGLMVIERNWLEVYPYTRWGGNANLPVLTVNQTFMPTELLLKDVTHSSAVLHKNQNTHPVESHKMMHQKIQRELLKYCFVPE